MSKVKCPKCREAKVRTTDNQSLYHPSKEECKKEDYRIGVDNMVYVDATCDACQYEFNIELPIVVATTGDILALKNNFCKLRAYQ